MTTGCSSSKSGSLMFCPIPGFDSEAEMILRPGFWEGIYPTCDIVNLRQSGTAVEIRGRVIEVEAVDIVEINGRYCTVHRSGVGCVDCISGLLGS